MIHFTLLPTMELVENRHGETIIAGAVSPDGRVLLRGLDYYSFLKKEEVPDYFASPQEAYDSIKGVTILVCREVFVNWCKARAWELRDAGFMPGNRLPEWALKSELDSAFS